MTERPACVCDWPVQWCAVHGDRSQFSALPPLRAWIRPWPVLHLGPDLPGLYAIRWLAVVGIVVGFLIAVAGWPAALSIVAAVVAALGISLCAAADAAEPAPVKAPPDPATLLHTPEDVQAVVAVLAQRRPQTINDAIPARLAFVRAVDQQRASRPLILDDGMTLQPLPTLPDPRRAPERRF